MPNLKLEYATMLSNPTHISARRRRFVPACAATLLGIAVALPPSALAQGRTDTIVLTGQLAPGVGSGTFSAFISLVLNDNGQTAFLSSITGGTNTQGLFRSDSGSTLTAIARAGASGGQSAPGVGGGTFSILGSPVLNASGQTAFFSSITGGTNTQGLFRSDSGSTLTAIARAGVSGGQSAPGVGAGTFSGLGSSPVLNASGQMAFFSSVSGGSNDRGVFRSDSGSTLTAITRAGQSAPGSGGGTFSGLGIPVLNDSGQTAFVSSITGGTSTQGLFRSDSGSTMTAIALAGQSAPGSGGGTFSAFNTPVLNDNGQVALVASITGGTNSQGLFRSDSGSTMTAIALAGQSAPGSGGGTFSSLSTPVLNASGQAAFVSSIAGGGNGQGIFRSDSGSALTAIARLGQSAPDTGGGTFSLFNSPALNDGGLVAFRALINGSANGVGVFLADGRDTVAVQLQGASLAGKTVSSVFSPSQDGLNNLGQVAYQATFTDDTSGLFRFTPALRWRESFSSSWATASNWTLGIAPGSVHDVTLDPSATLSVTGPAGAVSLRSLTVGGGTGFATLSLAGGSIGAASPVQIASRGILAGNGTLTAEVVNAGEVRADNLILSGGLTNNGSVVGAATGNQRIEANLTNAAGGVVRVDTGQRLRLVGTAHSNAGTFDLNGGEVQVTGVLTNNASGRILLNDARLNAVSGLTNNGQVQVTFGESEVFGAITNNAGGRIILSGNSNTTFYDALDVKSSGELRVSTGSTAVFFGLVQQRTGALFTGTGTKFYEGGLTIGGSPGLAVDAGDVNFGAGNVYTVDIGGTSACTAACDSDVALKNTSFDKYVVAGHLALGGTLTLAAWDGFQAQAGQRFDLLDWGSVSGSFDTIDASGLVLGAGLQLDTSQLYVDGSIGVTAVVPEPGSAALLLLGLAGVGGVASRRGRKA